MTKASINAVIGDVQKKELHSKIWKAADVFRDKIGIVQQMNYITSFMFYRYLSEQLEEYVNRDLKEEELTYTHTHTQAIAEQYKDYSIREYGYFLEPQYSWKEIIQMIRSGNTTWEINFKKGMKQIEEGSQTFEGLFTAVDLDNTKLSKDNTTRRSYFEETLKIVDSIDITFDDSHIDVLGETYEYLLGRFFESSINEAGKFFTPQAISEVIAKIVTHGKEKVSSVYDPTCGTGSLLFRVYRQLNGQISKLYGQDSEGDNITLAKMNMLLHGLNHDKFSLVQEDTLVNPQHLKKKFDIVVANPPYNTSTWMRNKSKDVWLSDERYKEWGEVSNAGNGDWMFMAHMIYQLDKHGIGATLFDTGLLTRGGVELVMRTHAVEKYIDAVILLPEKIFNKTGTQACLVIFKKTRTDKNILFINAENEFIKGSNVNLIKENNIKNIVDAYVKRQKVEYFTNVVSIEDIKAKKYDLNVSTHVVKKQEVINIDIKEVESKFIQNYKQIDELFKKIETMKKDLVGE